MMVSRLCRTQAAVMISFAMVLLTSAIGAMADDGPTREDHPGSIYDLIFEHKAYRLLEITHTSSMYEVYPVSGDHVFSDSILKTQDLVFQPNSNLILENLSEEYLIIVANRIKFVRPQDGHYRVSRRNIVLPNGTDGVNGIDGADSPHAPKGHNGTRGGSGGNGGDGDDGRSMDLPTLYIVANEVLLEGESNETPIKISFIYNGINGSNGGNGGGGGKGGKGGDGGEASQQALRLKCIHEPRDGGPGGYAGIGGAPGNGGDGANGGNIVFVGPQAMIEKFSFSRFEINSGMPGNGGTRGRDGAGGAGGQHGHRKGFCQRDSADGSSGSVPPNPHSYRGQTGKNGSRGRVHMIAIRSVSGLLVNF